jgi:hypothetical protein
MIDTYRLPASVAKSPTLKRMREDYHRSVRSQRPTIGQEFRQGMRATGGFLGGLCMLAVLFFSLWLFVQFIKFLWFF